MIYRVAFTKSGKHPTAALDRTLAAGIVSGKTLKDQDNAENEVWDYQVVENYAREFERALKDSDQVIEFDIVDLEVTPRRDKTP